MSTVEQIERDIAALEQAVSAIAVELHSAYTIYLTALGQAVGQQLVLASYHICTQGYPEAFLGLSFQQRQQLQQAIRKLGKQASEQLLVYIQPQKNNQEGEETGTLPPAPHLHASPNPMALAMWQRNLEQAIANTLKTVSQETNQLLQQTKILPQKLPEPILQAAINSSEGASEVTPGLPNLLNLMIETDNPEDGEDSSTVTHILAIQLRLPEIEFGELKLRSGRNQIRSLEVKVKTLGRDYYKKQRERLIAEAELTWRVSWFDE